MFSNTESLTLLNNTTPIFEKEFTFPVLATNFANCSTTSASKSISEQSAKQQAQQAEFEEVVRKNNALESQKRAMQQKIEDMKQILRLVNEQGEDRIAAIKARNDKLERQAETYRAAVAVERQFGGHFDNMAAFWRDEEVSQDQFTVEQGGPIFTETTTTTQAAPLEEREEREEREEEEESGSCCCGSSNSPQLLQSHLLQGTTSDGMKVGGSISMQAAVRSLSSTSDSDQDSDRYYQQQQQQDQKHAIKSKPEPKGYPPVSDVVVVDAANAAASAEAAH